MGAVIEMRGKIRNMEDYEALHRMLLRQTRQEHGENKAWSLVVLNWTVLPGAE